MIPLRYRAALLLALASPAPLALAESAQAQANGFIEDSTWSVLNRSVYDGREYRNGGRVDGEAIIERRHGDGEARGAGRLALGASCGRAAIERRCCRKRGPIGQHGRLQFGRGHEFEQCLAAARRVRRHQHATGIAAQEGLQRGAGHGVLRRDRQRR